MRVRHAAPLALMLAAAAPLMLVAAAPVPSPLASALAQVERAWAAANYTETAKPAQVAAFDAVIARADALAARYPDRAEPLVWRGVAKVSKAGVIGGLTGFGLVKDARRDLDTAQRLDPAAADGLGSSQLGVLYEQVPGPPFAFGNRVVARRYLDAAVKADDSLAANLAYGDHLFSGGNYAAAELVLRHALAAPPRPGQAVSEAGRRDEVKVLLAKIAAKRR